MSASWAPKAFVTILHAGVVAASVTYLLGLWPGAAGDAVVATPARTSLLIALAVIYLARLLVTQYVMVTRDFPWEEALPVGIWVVICQATFAWAGGTNADAVSWVAWAGVTLYAFGSWLNTGSEAARRRFKAGGAHRGELFTGHAFRFTRHPNYLGDSLLFTGFAMVTGSWWAAVIPVVMTAMFVGMHIPRLDAHMAQHYGEQWAAYAARTKKLVPGVY